jgi:hypothetical protein
VKRMLRNSNPLLIKRTALNFYFRPLLILLLLLKCYAGSAQVVLYVDDVNGNDANGGTSWPNAYKTVSRALYTARQNTGIDSILVAKGTYYPTGAQNGTNKDSSFVIVRGKLKLYGGYPNGGGIRDIAGNPTVLSGDIGTLNDSTDNSFHVMVIAGNIPSTADSIVVDGFTITKGNANGSGTVNYSTSPISQNSGGGMFMRENATGQKTALRNLTFASNTATYFGGGLEMYIASPDIRNCIFMNNHSLYRGGAFVNDVQASSYATGCSFNGNTANSQGGAVYNVNNTASPSFINCSFTGNNAVPLAPSTTPTEGGAIADNSQSTITNCIFTANRSTNGGGAMNINGNTVTTITYSIFDSNISLNGAGNVGTGGGLQIGFGTCNISNSVVMNNIAGGTADDGGGGLANYGGTFNCSNVTLYGNTTQSTVSPNSNGISIMAGAVNFNNSIAWGNPAQQVYNAGTFNYNYSLIKGITATLPNLNIDPQFADGSNPVGVDGIWGTADDGLRLTNCSPAVNMGSDALVPGSVTTDEAGNARIFGPAVDLGAYEFQSAIATINFTDISKTVGDADAAVPNVANCSGLPMSFTIADNSIATIAGSNLHIVNVGTTTITAHTLNGAPDVTVNLTIMAVLPIDLSLFKAEWLQQGKTARVKFVTENEAATCCYEIERSGDGVTFNTIGKVEARNSAGQNNYSFTDNKAAGKKLYYRLKTIFTNGNTEYSNLQLLQSNAATEIIVFPNPTSDVLQLLLNNNYGTVDVQIINSAGQTIKRISNVSGGGHMLKIPVACLNGGVYYLYLQSGTEMQVLQFVKQ